MSAGIIYAKGFVPSLCSGKSKHLSSKLLLFVSDLVKEQNLNAIFRVCSLTEEQRSALRLSKSGVEALYIDRYVDRVLQSPRMVAELVAHMLRELNICASNTDQKVQFTVDLSLGPGNRPEEAHATSLVTFYLNDPTDDEVCADYVEPLVSLLANIIRDAKEEGT